HADGIVMERIGEHTPIYPIDVKVSQNRRTLQSTYAPLPSFMPFECMAKGETANGDTAEKVALWTAFAGMQQRLEQLAEQNRALEEYNQALQTRCGSLRYRVADRLARLGARVPLAKESIEWLLG